MTRARATSGWCRGSSTRSGRRGSRWVARPADWLLPMRRSLDRLRDHAETSARMAGAAGCSPRTVELIRWQDEPRDPDAGERLRLADEAS